VSATSTSSAPQVRKRQCSASTTDETTTLRSSSVTSDPPASDELARRVATAFRVARNEVFEDGEDSQFAKELRLLISRFREHALIEINFLLTDTRVIAGVAAECVRALGEIKGDVAHSFRRWMILQALRDSRLPVRDASILALEDLNDRTTIGELRIAFEKETSDWLRQDLLRLVEAFTK
jgi:hypothetical protein